ncbi:hypothetical protein AZI87_10310 [Bdellovibrio bacteriovorus]|uniref:BLUF domain-containing protein n=1 Tax=Bdellovibrio bacteriovorus TaxID=959 RepID=A0A162H384_BDEBC|nr:BLUF domain-containing protein [Bdellovibrio bacteriovorus]KYG69559.1 hypothetical protein AZI87_10310 [Bdellovibrio bacteriovorus]
MGPVFQLVYLSQAAEDISYSDIQDILEVSRINNEMEEVTGVLIFRDGYFLQLLEGREQDVKKVLSKILMDDRNHTIRVLIETTAAERLFEKWSMAFYDGDISHNETADLVELFNTCLTGSRRTVIIPMLKKFQASAPEPQ